MKEKQIEEVMLPVVVEQELVFRCYCWLEFEGWDGAVHFC